MFNSQFTTIFPLAHIICAFRLMSISVNNKNFQVEANTGNSCGLFNSFKDEAYNKITELVIPKKKVNDLIRNYLSSLALLPLKLQQP